YGRWNSTSKHPRIVTVGVHSPERLCAPKQNELSVGGISRKVSASVQWNATAAIRRDIPYRHRSSVIRGKCDCFAFGLPIGLGVDLIGVRNAFGFVVTQIEFPDIRIAFQ